MGKYPGTAQKTASAVAVEAIASQNELTRRLRASRLRVTSGRIAVLQELVALSAPVSHAELALRLGEEEFDRVTVWRILVALTEAGLVDRTDVGDHTWRFEYRLDASASLHPHFMCVDCKSVRCLPRESVRIESSLASGVVEVQIKGRCHACASA